MERMEFMEVREKEPSRTSILYGSKAVGREADENFPVDRPEGIHHEGNEVQEDFLKTESL